MTVPAAVASSAGLGEDAPAGSFQIRNQSGGTLSIAAIEVAVSDPTLFVSMTLQGSGGTASASPVGVITILPFSSSVSVPADGVAVFDLSARIFQEEKRSQARSVVYAGMLPALPRMPARAWFGIGIGLALSPFLRRGRWLLGIALLAAFAAAAAPGCGNDPKLVSEQNVTRLMAGGGQEVAAQGLPALLGTVSVE